MKFGNWKITDDSIEYSTTGSEQFVVDTHSLLQKDDSEGKPLYSWLIKATEEEWLTDDDLYDLNFAFVYMAGKVSAEFEYEVFDNTMEYQYDMLDEEE